MSRLSKPFAFVLIVALATFTADASVRAGAAPRDVRQRTLAALSHSSSSDADLDARATSAHIAASVRQPRFDDASAVVPGCGILPASERSGRQRFDRPVVLRSRSLRSRRGRGPPPCALRRCPVLGAMSWQSHRRAQAQSEQASEVAVEAVESQAPRQQKPEAGRRRKRKG